MAKFDTFGNIIPEENLQTPLTTPAPNPMAGIPPYMQPAAAADIAVDPTVPPKPELVQRNVTSDKTVTTKQLGDDVTTYGPQTTTKGKQQTAEEIKLLGEQNKLDDDAIKIIKKKGELDKAKADILENQAIENKMKAEDKAAEQQAVMDKAEVDIRNRTSEYDERYNDYKNMKISDFWDDKSTGTKILAALFTGLGTLGSAMTGGKVENTAFKIIENAIDKDFNKQKANILQAKDTVGFAKEGIDMARSNKAEALRDLELKKTAALEVVANKYAEMLAKQGKPAAEIEQDLNLQKLRQEAQNRLLEVQKDLRKDVTTELERTVRSTKADQTVTTKGGTESVYKAPAKPDGVALNKLEGDLADRFNNLPEIKVYPTVKTAFDKLKGQYEISTSKEATADGKAQSDMALIYQFMKIQDPGSTVRESEFDTVRSTDSAFNRLQQLFIKAKNGETLSDDARNGILKSAKSGMAQTKLNVDKRAKEFQRQAKEKGVDPRNVVSLDLTEVPEEKKTETPPVPQDQTTIKKTSKPSWAE